MPNVTAPERHSLQADAGAGVRDSLCGSARHCLASNSTPHACRLRSGGYPSNLNMTTIEKTLKHDLSARLTTPTEKAAVGGRARFCSACCMDAYDAGWPVYGTTIADYMTRPVVTRPRPNSVTKRSRKRRSDAGKPGKRVLKAGSKALPRAA
jgi:hypothetical protein